MKITRFYLKLNKSEQQTLQKWQRMQITQERWEYDLTTSSVKSNNNNNNNNNNNSNNK